MTKNSKFFSPSDAHIRLARKGDLAAVQALNYALFEHDKDWIPYLNMEWVYDTGPDGGKVYFEKAIKGEENKVCFVAEVGGEVVGYLAGSIREPEPYRNFKQAELDNTLVSEAYRHRGIGKQLTAAFKDWCKQQGAQSILVVASAPNDGAIRFYESVGFKPYSLEMEMDLEES